MADQTVFDVSSDSNLWLNWLIISPSNSPTGQYPSADSHHQMSVVQGEMFHYPALQISVNETTLS